jgi:protein involved in polysaccharide export with SLBB domain
MKKTNHIFIWMTLIIMLSINLASHSAEQSWFNPMNAVFNNDFDNKSQEALKKNPSSNNQGLTNQNNAKNNLDSSMQLVDFSKNLKSNVFGANLFTGAFAKEGATHFNPKYMIAVGDNLEVKLWGAFDFQASLTVDPKGNIFVPNIGPLKVMGIRNDQLQKVFELAVARVFKNNVFSYISLAAAQPVKIFVSGYVNRPGLYSGTSMDNLLHFLDQAGGIDPDRGSFLNLKIMRGQQQRATINLYEFLLMGMMPMIQLNDGDVILVEPRQHTLKVTGLVDNPYLFEFIEDSLTITDLAKLARPKASATHVRVIRNQGAIRNIEYFKVNEVTAITLSNGDEVEFTADKKPGTITVRIEGEHLSAQEYVLPYGAKLQDLLKDVRYSERSDKDNLQLFRLSVKEREKQMLQTSLKSLESAALNASSGTSEEARLRKEESEMILQWIDRAKMIEPTGQVVIANSDTKENLLLENGDILKVPTKDGLVLISGEVLFPNAIAFDEKLNLEGYVKKAGGYSQHADASRVILARRDGSFTEISEGGFLSFASSSAKIQSGDEILVLPKIEVKSRQFLKEITQIVYQIAVSARIIWKL